MILCHIIHSVSQNDPKIPSGYVYHKNWRGFFSWKKILKKNILESWPRFLSESDENSNECGCCMTTMRNPIRRTLLIRCIQKQATHYSKTTTKRGWNESFAEKIVNLRNTTKTVLHAICWSSKVSHLKRATRYSLLYTNNDETTFSRKKTYFAKHDEKRSTHYSS